MNVKSLSRVEIKDADRGEVEAVFATLDVIDSDNDVTLKGAFENGAPVRISAYGHTSWKGELPVGKGTIRETKTEAVMDGRFFLETQAGLDTFTVVKEMSAEDGPGQEWSYGYDALDYEFGTKDGKRVRFLKKNLVHEVSPVLLGAGVDTRTLDVKGAKELPGGRTVNELRTLLRESVDASIDVPADNAWVWVVDFTDEWVVYELEGSGWTNPGSFQADYSIDDTGNVTLAEAVEVERRAEYVPKGATGSGLKFSEEGESVLTALDAYLDRARTVVAMRRSKGKQLGDESKALLERIEESLKGIDGVLRTPDTDADLQREYLRFLAANRSA